jgi:hypothetical protein
MTDVHQDESPRKPTKKRARAQKQSGQPPTFDPKDIAEGKKLAATLKAKDATLKSTQAEIDSAEMKLGKLADGQKPIYGDKTLAKFAKVIDIKFDRLNRCRSVYRAYKDKDIKGTSPKFGVYQALQGHPKRDEIIKELDPTVREARTLMKDYREAQGQKEDGRVRNTRGWFAAAKKHAHEAIQYGHPKQEHLDPNIMRQAIDDWDTLEASLHSGGGALIRLADEVKRARPLAFPTLEPMFDDKPNADEAAATDATSNEAAPDNATPDEAASSDAPSAEAASDNATPSEETT